MAQQPFSSTGSFFVRDKRSGKYHPATFLTYADGTPVVNSVMANGVSGYDTAPTLYANQAGTVLPNPNNYMVVPSADYMSKLFARGQAYGKLLRIQETAVDPSQAAGARVAADALLAGTYAPKLGYGDAQYEKFSDGMWDWVRGAAKSMGLQPVLKSGEPDSNFIQAFTDAGNFGVGVFFQAAGLPSASAHKVFGAASLHENPSASTYPLGNTSWGFRAINQGYLAVPTEASWLPQLNSLAPSTGWLPLNTPTPLGSPRASIGSQTGAEASSNARASVAGATNPLESGPYGARAGSFTPVSNSMYGNVAADVTTPAATLFARPPGEWASLYGRPAQLSTRAGAALPPLPPPFIDQPTYNNPFNPYLPLSSTQQPSSPSTPDLAAKPRTPGDPNAETPLARALREFDGQSAGDADRIVDPSAAPASERAPVRFADPLATLAALVRLSAMRNEAG